MASSRSGVILIAGLAAIAGALVGSWLLNGPLGSSAPQNSAVSDKQGELELAFATGDGASVSLDQFRGKAVLLNVWATWCPPCREEMPSLDRLQANEAGDDFQVVALSIDKGGVEQVRPFFEETKLQQLEIYLDQPGAAMQALKVVGMPTTLLIDKDGRELHRWVGPKEWDSAETVAEIQALIGQR